MINVERYGTTVSHERHLKLLKLIYDPASPTHHENIAPIKHKNRVLIARIEQLQE